MLAHHYMSALDLASAVSCDTADLAPRARTALQRVGDHAFALNAYAAAAGYYRAALALWPQDAQEQRAGLLLLLGTALLEAGETHQAQAVLAEGAAAAAAARLPALQARLRVLLVDLHASQGGPGQEALAECEAATAVLETEGDLEGLAEAWRLTGKIRFWLGDSPAGQQAFERAIACARQGGDRRVQIRASSWLASTFKLLTIPVDAAIARAGQLLQTANGEPWAEAEILMPLSVIYAYGGRFSEAREAIARAQSVYGRSEAKLTRAVGSAMNGEIELIAGNPATAERHLREAYEILHAAGERGPQSSLVGWLAEALYAQGRLDEAQQMTEEAEAATGPDDIDAQARWRTTRAKLLARRGQVPAALRLADEAEALVSPTSWEALKAEVLMAKAEVNRLGGVREQAAASLRAALRIYENQRAVPLAERARAALASVASQPRSEPA
ncbi:MAG: hypothetical protein ACTHPS_01470 [Streptosporangiaceae bacterium]